MKHATLFILLSIIILSCGKTPTSPLPVPERPENPNPQPVPSSAPSPSPSPSPISEDHFSVIDPISRGRIKGTIKDNSVLSIDSYEGTFTTPLYLGGTTWANPFSDDPSAASDPTSAKTCDGLAVWARSSGNSDLAPNDRAIAKEWLRHTFPVPVSTKIPLIRTLHPTFLKSLQALIEESTGRRYTRLQLDKEVLEQVAYNVRGNPHSLTLIALDAIDTVQHFFEPFRSVTSHLTQETRFRDILCDLKAGNLKVIMTLSFSRGIERKYVNWTIDSFHPEVIP